MFCFYWVKLGLPKKECKGYVNHITSVENRLGNNNLKSQSLIEMLLVHFDQIKQFVFGFVLFPNILFKRTNKYKCVGYNMLKIFKTQLSNQTLVYTKVFTTVP